MRPHELRTLIGERPFLEGLREAYARRGLSPPPEGRLSVDYVRFKPNVGCLLGLRDDSKPDAIGPGYLKIFLSGDPEACYLKYRAREKDQGWVESLPEFRAVYFHFPLDRGVDGLPALTDPQRLKHVLHESVPGFSPDAERIRARKTRVRPLKYKPERRCIVRADLSTRDRNGTRGERRVVAQAYADETGEQAFAAMRHLEDLGSEGFDALRIPAPLGYHAARRILVQDWVVGEPLGTRLTDANAEQGCCRAARAVAELHGASPLGSLPFRPVQSVLSEAARVLEDLLNVGHAAVEEKTLRLRDELKRAAHRVRPVAPSIVHGDFHYHQLLVSPTGATLIDWDETHLGDPRTDVANFLAHLHLVEIEGRLDERAARSYRAAFVDAYSAGPAASSVLPVLTSAQLAKLALVPFRNLEPDWFVASGSILDRSRQLLDAHAEVTA